MKKITILLLLTTVFGFSQVKNGSIAYSLVLTEDKEFLSLEGMGSIYKMAIEDAKNIEFSLNFDAQESYFKIKDIMNSNTADSDIAKSFSGYSAPIYSNSLTKKTLQTSSENFFPKDKYIVEKEMVNDWVLRSETKMIDNYLCYKAETVNVVVNPKGTFRHPVTAWYCPKIPFPFGPKGYGNLPGLILELQVRNVVFGAKSIVFNSSEKLEIIKPTKGKMISYEDYNKEVAKIADQMFSGK